MDSNVQRMHDVWYPSALPPEIDLFVESHGAQQQPGPMPRGWGRRRMRRPGYCYTAAGNWAFESGVTYTEGKALMGVGWIPHAWLTSDDGAVIDLSPGVASEYHGILVPERIFSKAIVRLGVYTQVLPTAIYELGWAGPQVA